MSYPKVWIRTEEEEDLKPLAERDEILHRMGLKMTAKYFYETYAIPEPKEGEETVGQREEVRKPGSAEGGSNGLNSSNSSNRSDKEGEFAEAHYDLITAQKEIDSLADNALKDIQGSFSLQALYDAVDAAESYEDIQQKIAEMYDGLDMKRFNDILAQAIFIAELRGRALGR